MPRALPKHTRIVPCCTDTCRARAVSHAVRPIGHIYYRTTHKTATGETSFALAFGHEVVVPADIGVGTHRTEYFNEE